MRAAAVSLLALAAGARADGHALTVDWKEFMSSTEQALTADHAMDIVFAWEGDYGDGGTHNVYMMPTKEAYDACDLSQIVTYAEARHGDDAHEASGFTISAQELAEAYGYDTPTYWICEVSDHCANAQKITITVSGDDEHADGDHDGDHAEEHDDHDGHDHDEDDHGDELDEAEHAAVDCVAANCPEGFDTEYYSYSYLGDDDWFDGTCGSVEGALDFTFLCQSADATCGECQSAVRAYSELLWETQAAAVGLDCDLDCPAYGGAAEDTHDDHDHGDEEAAVPEESDAAAAARVGAAALAGAAALLL